MFYLRKQTNERVWISCRQADKVDVKRASTRGRAPARLRPSTHWELRTRVDWRNWENMAVSCSCSFNPQLQLFVLVPQLWYLLAARFTNCAAQEQPVCERGQRTNTNTLFSIRHDKHLQRGFAPVLEQQEGTRTSLRRGLDWLSDLGWTARPGYSTSPRWATCRSDISEILVCWWGVTGW